MGSRKKHLSREKGGKKDIHEERKLKRRGSLGSLLTRRGDYSGLLKGWGYNLGIVC